MKQLKYADRMGMKLAVIVGPDEDRRGNGYLERPGRAHPGDRGSRRTCRFAKAKELPEHSLRPQDGCGKIGFAYGGRSSMAECVTVDHDVAGSTPVAHPSSKS